MTLRINTDSHLESASLEAVGFDVVARAPAMAAVLTELMGAQGIRVQD